MGCVHGKCCSRYPNSSNGDPWEAARNNMNAHRNLKYKLTERSLECVKVPSHNFHLEYSFLTQKGYYPDSPDKENQDSLCIKTQLQGNPNLHFFGVFDGHGQFGTQCANFVKDRLVEILSNDPTLSEDPVKAYNSAFQATNLELHGSEIDDSMSGTTAITVVVCGDTLFVANVGDSRAVIAVKNGNRAIAEDLSCDQTPFRKDECERVKLCGARVLSADQVEGIKDPDIQSWGDEENDGDDPPRLWVQNGLYPGTAFTRSLGDSTAEKIGVIPDPEVLTVQLTPNHLFFVIASDGVFEFLTSQIVVNMVMKYSDTRDACAAIAAESYRMWLDNENRTDDITVIVIRVKGLRNEVAQILSKWGKYQVASIGEGNGILQHIYFHGSEACHSLRSESDRTKTWTDRSFVCIMLVVLRGIITYDSSCGPEMILAVDLRKLFVSSFGPSQYACVFSGLGTLDQLIYGHCRLPGLTYNEFCNRPSS